MTVRAFLTRAMIGTGVIASGDSMSAAEAADGLLILNEIVDSWSADGDLRSHKIVTDFVFAAGQAQWLFSQSAKLVDYATIKAAGSDIETEIKVMTMKEWALFKDKNALGVPTGVFIDDTGGGMAVLPFPVPNATYTINLYRGGMLDPYDSLNDEMSLSPGYSRALRYECMIELAQEFDKTLKPSVFMKADQLKADIKRANYQPSSMKSDAFGISSNSQKTYDNTTGE